MGEDLTDEKERETKLLVQAKAGDSQAWLTLLVPARRRLLENVRQMVKDQTEAEDLVQEALLALYVDVQHFRGDARVYTYLWRIAQNKILNRLRDGKLHRRMIQKHTFQDAHTSGPLLGPPTPTPEKIAGDRERVRTVSAALDCLNPKMQDTLLRAVDEAEAIGMGKPGPLPTKERVARHRARQELWSQLSTLEKKEDDR